MEKEFKNLVDSLRSKLDKDEINVYDFYEEIVLYADSL